MTKDTQIVVFGEEPASPRPSGYGYGPGPAPSLTHLRPYLEAPFRRPFLTLIPFVLVLAAAISLAVLLPKMYRSSTLILVESEKMPDSFVRSMATENSNKRLVTIQQEILSRTRLQTIIEEFNPYPHLLSQTAAIEAMRRATTIAVKGNDAFAIEYVHRDPEKAQQVTGRLGTLFIEESAKAREQQVEEAYDFLDAQVRDARRELEVKDASIRAYKEQHMGNLPEQTSANLATLQMLQQEQQAVEAALRDARQREDLLEKGLSDPRPASAPTAPGAAEKSTDLTVLRSELLALRGRYTEEHPDVQSLKSRIARLERQYADVSARTESTKPTNVDPPFSPARSQYEKLQIEIRNLEARRAELVRRADSFHARVEQAPRTEQELATLTRDYQKLNESYLALLSKKLDAQMAARLEKRWKGEHFSILDPAHLPERPYSPNRPLFVTVGLFLGFIVGIGAALAAEFVDSTVKDVEDLQSIAPFPVLATIPHVAQVEAASRALLRAR
jgi:polysaccharide chain length determinant protein (PEP-CTERM system associated)